MSVLLLVRHGQASFGTDDYDRLSPVGLEQSRVLGAELGRRTVDPVRIVSGGMKRQLQTAAGVAGAASWAAPVDVDPGWDEFNATELLDAFPEVDPAARNDSRVFQRMLERASSRWASGDHDGDYRETFAEFTGRVDAALARAVAGLGSGQTGVVVSSSGAIAWATARLLNGGFDQWLALNRVTVNTGVTKIVAGASGTSLLSFNDHSHLSSAEVTYR